VLLSFAQFEREVTGERIRDKIVASKRKGMWMGGIVPLGYDASERTLVVNAAEAETVRCIFALYRELGCVRRVKEEADRLGLSTKRSTTAGGIERGGRPFSRGHIYNLLSNPIYIGEIAHKGQLYPGQHPALIDADTWAAVRDQLAANARDHRRKAHATEPSLLAGLLTDAQGERLTPSHAVKKDRRYRYYVSTAQQADFPHCALGQDLTPSPTTGRGRVGSDVRARSTRRGARVDSSRACVACPCA
jgi:site-specific DNA recombinase